jgi:hypothetical protein
MQKHNHDTNRNIACTITEQHTKATVHRTMAVPPPHTCYTPTTHTPTTTHPAAVPPSTTSLASPLQYS